MNAARLRTGQHRRRRTGRRALRAGTVVAVSLTLFGGQSLGWGAWVSTSATASTAQVTAASLSVPAPTPAQVLTAKTVGLSWASVVNATSYEVRYYAVATGGTGTVVCTSATTSCVDPNNRAGSGNWYSVTARVGSNWATESSRAAYTADTTTATPTITSLGADAGASTSDFITKTAVNTLNGTAEADATVVIRRSGVQVATATANDTGNWTSSAFTLNEGTQSLTATATDAYANTATSLARSVRLDTVAPAVGRTATCATPGNAAATGFWCKQTSLSMTATFSDTGGSGLQTGSSEYNNDGAGWTDYTGAVSLGEDNGRVVQLRATDIAGNQGLTSVTYYIDGTPPLLTVTEPSSSFYSSVTVLNNALAANCAAKAGCGTSSDAISPVTVMWKLVRGSNSRCYKVTGGWGTCTGYAFQSAAGTLPSWTLPMASVYSGGNTYTGTSQSTDQAGNITVLSGSFSVN